MQSYISPAGQAYRQAVIDTCLVTSAPTNITGTLACTLDLYPPCNRRRDCDNFAKGLLDALAHANVYADDSQIVDLRIRMHPKQPPGKVTVTLEPLTHLCAVGAQLDFAETLS